MTIPFTTFHTIHQKFSERKMKQAAEKVMTRHPLGKSGKNIDKGIYETVKDALITILGSKEITHTELLDQLNKRLKNKVEGNIGWYGETVKLDLEARKIIERTDSKPQKYRLTTGKGLKG